MREKMAAPGVCGWQMCGNAYTVSRHSFDAKVQSRQVVAFCHFDEETPVLPYIIQA